MSVALKRITEPTSEPITLEMAKNQLKVDFDDDDGLIAGMISGARDRVERYLGRSIMSQQWLYALDEFPCYRAWDFAPSRTDYNVLGQSSYLSNNWNQSQAIYIPRAPLLSLDEIAYIDQTGTRQILDPSQYIVDEISEPARVLPQFNSFWPPASYTPNAVQIKFTAGYQNVPQGIITALLLTITWLYTNREDVGIKDVPKAAEFFLETYQSQPFGLIQS